MKNNTRKFEKGEYLIHQNEFSRHMFIIKSGAVRIIRQDSSHVVYTREIGAGGIVGELALIDGEPRSASVIALEEVEAVMVPPDEFDIVNKKLPPWIPALSRAIAFRTRTILSKLQRTPGTHLSQNVLAMLIYQSIFENEKLEFEEDVLIKDLAGTLRIPENTVFECLEQLAAENLLSIKNGKISINSLSEMEKYHISHKKAAEEDKKKAFKP